MSSFWFDLRDAIRGFRHDRAYVATVILTLALAIGATTAVYSIVDGVLLQPLPYRDPGRLVALREIWREFENRLPIIEVNERHFEYWREHQTSFEALAQYGVRPANLTGAGEAAEITLVRASGSLFDVLGVHASIGRTLSPQDEAPGAADVVVISNALWRERMASDGAIVGKSMALDGRPFTVVGVLPASFRLPRAGQLSPAIDAFIPLAVAVGWVGDHNNEAIGRLRAGVTPESARAELDTLQAQVSEIASTEAREPVTLASVVRPLAEHVLGTSRRGLLLLLGAIAAVLLIACSNLANLSLTRALGRLREASIRTALGASRRRLIAHTILEQLLLSISGGALGIWVAWIALAGLVRTAPIDLPRVHDVRLSPHALLLTAVVSILSGVLLAALPAARIAVRDVEGTLRASASSIASDRGWLRAHALLLAMQVALSVTLLVVTALFGISLVRVMTTDRGFTADRVLVVELALPANRYATEPVRQATYDRLLGAARTIPGVERVSITSMLPLGGQGQVNLVATEGNTLPISELPPANFRFVAPDFFATLGIAIRRGRSFTDGERDPNRPAPAVISDATAKRLWPGEDPIGKRFSRGLTTEQGFQVVGVAADARTTTLDRPEPLMVYVPYWWRSRPSTGLLVRTAVDPTSIVPEVRRVIRQIDPEIAVGDSRPLEALVDASVAARRFQTRLFVIFGLVGLFIAIVGVYAITASGVERRRREMNIRVAVGAQTSQVLGLVLRQGMTPVVAGVTAGIGGALATGRLVAGLLFDVQAGDPLVIASVVACVGSAGLVTCVLAARRGLSIDPAAALREE